MGSKPPTAVQSPAMTSRLSGTVANKPQGVPTMNYAPIQAPPIEEPAPMQLSSPDLAVPFAPNSFNPVGASKQPDPKLAILKNFFSVNRSGGM